MLSLQRRNSKVCRCGLFLTAGLVATLVASAQFALIEEIQRASLSWVLQEDPLSLSLSAISPPPPPPPPQVHKTPPRELNAALRQIPPEQRVTSHWCHSRDFLDDNQQRATCLFHHVCVVPRVADANNPREVEFLYVVANNQSQSEQEKTLLARDASFTLGIGPHQGDPRLLFTPRVVTQSQLESHYPERQHASGTSTLFYEFNAENFGHMLTDVLMPIYVALESFGLLDQNVQMYRYSIMDAIGWSCDFHRRLKKGVGFGNVGAHCDRFYSMMPRLMKGHQPLHVLNGTQMSPVCFDTLVVGMAMFSDDCLDGSHGRLQDRWSLCNMARQAQFWNFRNYMLTNAGVSLEPPTKHKITVTKPQDGKGSVRGLSNLNALVANLRDTYPHIEVAVVVWPELSLKEQLEMIRTTTVHLTPPGGVSFISLFLPKWATSVRLYSVEYRMEYHIYHYLGYMTVEHVDCPNRRIPLKETMQYVAKSLVRYDSFRGNDGTGSWNPVSQSLKAHPLVPRIEAPPPPPQIMESPMKIESQSPIHRIPKVLYQSWITRTDMPSKMQENVDKWQSQNPDYKYMFYNDDEQRDWMQNHCKKYWPAWRDMQLAAARSDLFRYCILYKKGGVWSDIDIVPEVPMNRFIPETAELVVVHDGFMKEHGDRFLYNAFMASRAGHPALEKAMDIVWENYQERRETGVIDCTGPGVLWKGVNATLAQKKGSSFVGYDPTEKVEYLTFDGAEISNLGGRVLFGKYHGYLEDAKTHGGEPHYGRTVTWATKAKT